MKKRYLAVFMTAALALGMAGCGRNTENVPKDTETGAESSETDNTDEKKEDTDVSGEDEDAGKQDDDAKKESSAPNLVFTTKYYDAGENYQYIYGKYMVGEVTGENYPELKASVNSWYDEYEKNYNATMEQSIEDAKMLAEDMGDDFYSYSFEYSANAVRLDENITSIVMDEYSYQGGAHGYDGLYGITFDTKTGKELAFSDLGDIRETVRGYMDEQIQKKREEGGSFEFYEDHIDSFLDSPVWYLDGIGLSMVFNAYEIGSYAEGRTIITIPYDKMTGFNKEYELTGDSVFAQLFSDTATEIDVNGDGELEKVEISSEYDDNYETKLSVKVNDTSLELGTCAYMTNAYYAKCENGRSFVLVSCDMMSDDYGTFLVEVTDGTPKLCETFGMGGVNSISNDGVVVSGNVYVLGTYCGVRAYSFEEGSFQPIEERFVFDNDKNSQYRKGPVLKSSLKVQIEENGSMVQKELEAGTAIYPVDTDGETIVGFELEDGTYGEITFERKDGTIYIDGVSEYDLFNELPYAG